MKPKSTLRNFLALACSAILAVSSASAATYYWDNNGATAGFGTATGTWDGTGTVGSGTLGWGTDATGLIAPTGTITTASTNATTDALNFGTASAGLTTGTITVAGTVEAGNITFGAASGAILLSGGTAINLTAASTITVNNATNTIGTALTGAGTSFTKAGNGALVLTGANLYTGTTIINGGTLTLNRQTGSLASTTPLTFSGTGTFNMDNTGASGALTQTLGALSFSAGQGTVQITRTADFDQAITFASLAARTAGASGNFVNAGGTNSATNGFIFTSAPTAGALIDRGIFYNGSSYATYDSGGFIRAYGSLDTNYSSTNTTIANDSTKNVELTGAIADQGTASVNTINMGANSLAQTAATTLSTNGILSSGSASASISGGTIRAISSGGEQVIRVNGSSDVLTVSSVIANNSSASRLTKSGDGTLVLTTTATYTGVTAINAGTLQLGNGGATGGISSSSTIVNNGSLFINYTAINQTLGAMSGTGSVTYTGGAGSLALNTNNTFSGGFTMNSGTVNNIPTGTYGGFGTGTVTATGGSFGFGGSSATIINNNLNWGGSIVLFGAGPPTPTWNGTLTLSSNLTLSLGLVGGTTYNSPTFTGNISGAYGITVNSGGGNSGPNVITLSGANNTFSGGLTLNTAASKAMVLNINSATALGATAGTFTIDSNNLVTIDNTSAAAITLTNNNPLAINGSFTFKGTRDLNMGTGAVNLGGATRTITTTAGTFTLGGVISNGGITKAGAGILVLSGANDYVNATTVSAGTLVAGSNAPSGSAGAFGNASSDVALGTAGGNSDASILIGGAFNVGRIVRLATSNTSDLGTRVLTLGGNTAHNSEFSGNIFLGTASQAGRGVTLTAASGGQVTFSGVIQNPSGMDATTYTVTKAGLGTVVLSNTNNYTGATTVSAGTLYVTGALSNSAVTVQSTGTIGSNGVTGTLGNGLSIDAGGNLDLTGATLSLNSTGILSLTSGTLTLGNLTFEDLIGWDYANAAVGTYELVDGTYTTNMGSTAYLDAGTAYNLGNGTAGYFTSSGSLNAVIFAIPEPRAALLGCLGVLLLFRRRR